VAQKPNLASELDGHHDTIHYLYLLDCSVGYREKIFQIGEGVIDSIANMNLDGTIYFA